MTTWRDMGDAVSYGAQALSGEQVHLRGLADDDLPTLERWWSEPQVALLQRNQLDPLPAGAMVETFRGWCANNQPGAIGLCIVRTADDVLIGQTALWGADVRTRAATLGVILGPEFSGQGYGTDALQVMVRYGFDEMGLHRIELAAYAYNARALATYRKVGFVEEGRRRDSVFHAGSFHDTVVMGLLEPEWRQGGH